MWVRLAAAAAVLGSGATPAAAADYGTVGGWDIMELDVSCAMAMEFEGKGSTKAILYRDRDGSTMLGIFNDLWSSKENETYDISVELDHSTYGSAKAAGLKLGNKPGFALTFNADSPFFQEFRSSGGLSVYLGEQIIDDLSLAGTNAAGAETDRCLSRLDRRLGAEERKRAKYDYLPDDPFAAKANSAITGTTQAAKQVSLRSFGFDDSDYPSAALRNEESGTTVVRLQVGVDGRASSCTVTKSSGSSTLDTATCRLIQVRSRFTPAEDNAGNKIEGEITTPMTWRLPR